MERDPVFTVRLDEEHQALLEALTAHERLGRSDIFRRALRAYAHQLGVTPSKPKPKPKKK